jgi:hypothetical protein
MLDSLVFPVVATSWGRLSSGRYTLVDVACRSCGTTLGWRYVQCSAGPEMMYKQGCSLLEQVTGC